MDWWAILLIVIVSVVCVVLGVAFCVAASRDKHKKAEATQAIRSREINWQKWAKTITARPTADAIQEIADKIVGLLLLIDENDEQQRKKLDNYAAGLYTYFNMK